MSTISGIVFLTSGRKSRSTASPMKPSSIGGRPTIVARYVGRVRRVRAVTWKTGKSSSSE